MIPETLAGTNCFIDGISFAGEVPSLTLPKITVKTDEYRAGGMDGPIEMDMGLEKLEAGFTTTGMRREALKFVGLTDQTAFNAVFRGSFRGKGGVEKAVAATFRGGLKEGDPGDWKAGDKAETKFSISPTYYKLEIDGEVMYEIDPLNSVRVIDGVDQLEQFRANLGL